ncbi:DUF6328 family protein [Pseudoduganella sp. UC29_106]|uniref:DUF6328 family protein n=1 Tax=Pseudoduganella sp. UC29_106 TaxID=3374553 RepID=UPI0037576F51
MDPPTEKESLKDQMSRVIEEARMVLPGIQALFGFQTIAVFNEPFKKLPMHVQDCHVGALALVVMAIALVMMPAAYHRLAEPGRVSHHAIKVSSAAICSALLPLAGGLALDVYVVLHMVTDEDLYSALGGGAAFLLLTGFWFGYPLFSRLRRGGEAG